MKYVLFGSYWNPLSAIAAQCLHERDELGIVITSSPLAATEFAFGQIGYYLVGVYRLFQIVLRKMGIKRSEDYSSLGEFLVDNPVVRHVDIHGDLAAGLQVLDGWHHNIRHFGVVSCIFPRLIPVRLFAHREMINIHPGLLPQNRGPNPYFWDIALGHEEGGITMHVLSEEFDTGDVLFQARFKIGATDTEYRLERKACQLLKLHLTEVFCKWRRGELRPQVQTEGRYFGNPDESIRRKYKVLSPLLMKRAR